MSQIIKSNGKFDVSKEGIVRSLNLNEVTGTLEIVKSEYGYPQIIYIDGEAVAQAGEEVEFTNKKGEKLFSGTVIDNIPTKEHARIVDILGKAGLTDKIGKNKICFYTTK